MADPTGVPRRRLWIVNHYADAPDRASGTRHFDLARRLVAGGHDVTIFASGFSHVTGREERLRRWQVYRRQSFDGVRFIWLRTTPYRGNGGRRQLNMLSFVLSFLIVQCRVARPDVVIGSTVHPFAAWSAWLASVLRRAAFAYEIRDLWPQTLVDMGAMRVGSIGERVLRAIEGFLVRRAFVVIALLPGIADYLRQRGLPASHVLYVPNGVDLTAFDAAAAAGPATSQAAVAALGAARRLEADGRVVFGYAGAFGLVNDIGTIVEAARLAEVSSPGAVGLLLIGDGPERAAIERQIDGLSGVAIAAPVPKRAVPAVLRGIHVGVVHATATPVYRYGISFNKVFEYFAAGRPVLFACTSSYDPVDLASAGISIPPSDPQAMAEAMIALSTTSIAERAAMGASARTYVEDAHDIARLAERLAGQDGLGRVRRH